MMIEATSKQTVDSCYFNSWITPKSPCRKAAQVFFLLAAAGAFIALGATLVFSWPVALGLTGGALLLAIIQTARFRCCKEQSHPSEEKVFHPTTPSQPIHEPALVESHNAPVPENQPSEKKERTAKEPLSQAWQQPVLFAHSPLATIGQTIDSTSGIIEFSEEAKVAAIRSCQCLPQSILVPSLSKSGEPLYYKIGNILYPIFHLVVEDSLEQKSCFWYFELFVNAGPYWQQYFSKESDLWAVRLKKIEESTYVCDKQRNKRPLLVQSDLQRLVQSGGLIPVKISQPTLNRLFGPGLAVGS